MDTDQPGRCEGRDSSTEDAMIEVIFWMLLFDLKLKLLPEKCRWATSKLWRARSRQVWSIQSLPGGLHDQERCGRDQTWHSQLWHRGWQDQGQNLKLSNSFKFLNNTFYWHSTYSKYSMWSDNNYFY